MGDSGRGQSLMYGDAEEEELQEQNRKTEISRLAKTDLYGDAGKDDAADKANIAAR